MNDEMEERFEDAWKQEWDDMKYHGTRKGDHLLTPFECDRCIFIKLKGRQPVREANRDKLLMAAIRRVNLDAMWSRKATTVARNLEGVRRIINTSATVGLQGPFKSYGPMPLYDHCGYEIAIDMVLASKLPGRYNKQYLQFDAIRKLRTSYGNFERISSLKVKHSLVLDGGSGETKDISNLTTSSV